MHINKEKSPISQPKGKFDRQSSYLTGRPPELVYQERSPSEYKWSSEVNTVIFKLCRHPLLWILLTMLCLFLWTVLRDSEFIRADGMKLRWRICECEKCKGTYRAFHRWVSFRVPFLSSFCRVSSLVESNLMCRRINSWAAYRNELPNLGWE
jgi:hypothetical protein